MTKRTGTIYERELQNIFIRSGFIVARAAGSHGIDIVAVRPDISVLIEVKSTKSERYHLSGAAYKQYRALARLRKHGFNAVMMIRKIGGGEDAWYVLFPEDTKRIGVIDLAKLQPLHSFLDSYGPGTMSHSMREYDKTPVGNDAKSTSREKIEGVN